MCVPWCTQPGRGYCAHHRHLAVAQREAERRREHLELSLRLLREEAAMRLREGEDPWLLAWWAAREERR